MLYHNKLERQVKKLVKDESTTTLTKDDFVLNAVFTMEKTIASISQIKDAIRGKKDRINMNEFLIIGAEFERILMEIDAIRREHHL